MGRCCRLSVAGGQRWCQGHLPGNPPNKMAKLRKIPGKLISGYPENWYVWQLCRMPRPSLLYILHVTFDLALISSAVIHALHIGIYLVSSPKWSSGSLAARTQQKQCPRFCTSSAVPLHCCLSFCFHIASYPKNFAVLPTPYQLYPWNFKECD